MASDEKSRLWQRIVRQSDPRTLLERMRLYGFWPAGVELPEAPAEEAAARAAIEQEIARLLREQAVLKDPQKALAQERKRRWLESKARRAERKAQRLADAERRRQEHKAYCATTLVHAGEGVSAGLQGDRSDESALARRGLPLMHRSEDLARAMEVSVGSLRWLAYHRRSAALVHYHRYQIAKKTGGVRAISAPKPALAKAQRWVLENILQRLDVPAEAHGFVRGRSIVTGAAPHVGRGVVVNLDLKDFFPSITFPRVKGLFGSLGYSEHLATTLALLCTEPPRVAVELHGKVHHVALGERVLPQGACTSPAITNALCRRLDRRLAALAERHGFAYTRYADDLTLSGENAAAVGRLLRSVRSIVADEGFQEHPAKTRVMRQSRRQEVTGLRVNERLTVDRREVRRLRAILHNAQRHGLESQNREGRPDFAAWLKGKVAFITMVDPERGKPLAEALRRALERR